MNYAKAQLIYTGNEKSPDTAKLTSKKNVPRLDKTLQN